MEYLSAKDTAKAWGISQRRVSLLCAEKRIEGATFVGNMWLIPKSAQKPVDKRTLRYKKERDADESQF